MFPHVEERRREVSELHIETWKGVGSSLLWGKNCNSRDLTHCHICVPSECCADVKTSKMVEGGNADESKSKLKTPAYFCIYYYGHLYYLYIVIT